jgi:hypothetical protein
MGVIIRVCVTFFVLCASMLTVAMDRDSEVILPAMTIKSAQHNSDIPHEEHTRWD